MKCDIVIPVWNKKDLTERCVNSIFSSTSFPYRIILIDNASEDELTRRYLETLSVQNPRKVKLIKNKENLGYTKAGNQGMSYGDADYVSILNNDTIVCKGWLSEMVKVAEMHSDIGIVNPSSNSFGLRKKKAQSFEEFATKLINQNSGKFVELGAAVGFCYLIKRKVIDEVGCWNEEFSPGYFEDTEYSVRAKKKGYKSVMALGAYVYHQEHASFKSKEKKKAFQKLFNERQNKFYALHAKPSRALYVITKRDSANLDSLKKRTYHDADMGNWVNVFLKDTVGDIGLARHGNIKGCVLGSAFFNLKVLMRVVTKKKKFNTIYIDDKTLFAPLLFVKRIHRADVRWLDQ